MNGSAFSTQAHITSVSVKKRKPTNRGCVLTKQAWLGIIEHRKAAEYELRRLLTLKYEKNDNHNNHKKNDELQHQKTGISVFILFNYSKSTLINDDKSESIDPSHPESEIEENYDLGNKKCGNFVYSLKIGNNNNNNKNTVFS
ncbi:unnamed protein product [Schistosoma curassoni]|uniref:Uncharacterized protein n=1 Tax=Schistosoma curassoni TaxID=6186 RepID=A0A183L0E1_9TREM|nr:unnamed protein product [Schistosoma curassoni]